MFYAKINNPNKTCNSRLDASRFVLVCPNGHIEDFPYSWWVHKGNKCDNPNIIMYNVDNRSDLDSLYVECKSCGVKRGMAQAFLKNAFRGDNEYPCKGKHPHLGSDYASASGCNEYMTARMRSSSSIYFPLNISALAIPPWSRRTFQMIEHEYDTLILLEQSGEKVVTNYIKNKILGKQQASLSELLEVFKLIKEQKKSTKGLLENDIYAAEYNILCKGLANDDDYVASFVQVPDGFKNIFDSITVVDKLSVIEALVGFTRNFPLEGGIFGNKRLAPLSSKKKKWLPAVKLLGEGIFFKFNYDLLSEWESYIGNRYQSMNNEFIKGSFKNDRFSPKYVSIHTFAHLLIRQLAEECGYNASTMKEKVYSTFMNDSGSQKMSGVLIYLSTSDTEGSLGGLISIANDPKRLKSVLKNMLYRALWCSADPLCYNSTEQGFHSLNYAACHGCVLLPETSCEFRNVLLDRVAVVGKPEDPKLGFMGEISASLMDDK